MSEPVSASDPGSRQSLDGLPGSQVHADPPPHPIARDIVDSRARLCFRALALCLAAVVQVLISASLHAATMAFIDGHRARTSEGLHVLAAEFPAAGAAPSEQRKGDATWPHAIVALISILLIGDVALAIGLIRATFAMTVNTDRESTIGRAPSPEGTDLPGIGMLKAIAEAFSTVLKGLPKR